MAERERLGYHRGAIAYGLRKFLAVTVVTYGFGYGLRFAFAPILRDFAGGRGIPSLATLGVLAAVVGGLAGLSGVRRARRVVASGPGDGRPGARALVLARRAADPGPGDRVAGPVSIQRWTSDLLAGDDRVPVQEAQLSDDR